MRIKEFSSPVINSQSKSHSNDHKMGVIEQKDQKKLRNSETTRKTRMGTSLDFVKNAFLSCLYTKLCISSEINIFVFFKFFATIIT